MPGSDTTDLRIVEVYVKILYKIYFFQISELERPLDVPDHGLICDLLWSDPDEVCICETIKFTI